MHLRDGGMYAPSVSAPTILFGSFARLPCEKLIFAVISLVTHRQLIAGLRNGFWHNASSSAIVLAEPDWLANAHNAGCL